MVFNPWASVCADWSHSLQIEVFRLLPLTSESDLILRT